MDHYFLLQLRKYKNKIKIIQPLLTGAFEEVIAFLLSDNCSDESGISSPRISNGLRLVTLAIVKGEGRESEIFLSYLGLKATLPVF